MKRVLPSLQRVAGPDHVVGMPLITGSEDFAHYAELIPSVYFVVGVTPPGEDPLAAPNNHSPLFYVDEPGLALATRALAAVAVDYLQKGQ